MKKGFKKVTLIVSIVAISLIGFSSAVYGRFSRQFNPEVSSFGISISSQENMMISSSGEAGTFTDTIKFSELVSDTSVTLTPLTGKVTTTVDGEYQNLTLTNSSGVSASSGYYSFPLYFMSSSDMNLYLKGNNAGTVATFDDSNADKSFTSEQRERLLANLRIGFKTYSTTYQPSGTGITINYSNAPVSSNVYATSKIETENYTTFNLLGYSGSESDTILATTTKSEIKKIEVVIWLEDDGLGDLEAICNLTLSLRFEAVLVNS